MDEMIVAVVLCVAATLISVYQLNYLLVLVNESLRTRLKRNMEQLVQSLSSGLSRGAARRCCRGRVCKPRRSWSRPGRTRTWWDNFVNDVVVPEEWRENFRMTKTSFLKLCEELRPHIQRQSTVMRSPIEMERQVAATIYYFSDEGRLQKTANAFGLSRSGVSVTL